MPDPGKSTVGDTRKALGNLTGQAPAAIQHYVIAIDSDDGVILKFCCNDRRAASRTFAAAAELVVTVRGEPLHPGGLVPGMAVDN